MGRAERHAQAKVPDDEVKVDHVKTRSESQGEGRLVIAEDQNGAFRPSALEQVALSAGAGTATAGGAVDLAASQALGGNGGDVVETVVKDEHDKIGRNDPCWCGSGKKYKKCHGS